MDVVVTVPKQLWADWIAEGDLPGEPWSRYTSHFWIAPKPFPDVSGRRDDRLYIVAHGKLRGYAPITDFQRSCSLNWRCACIQRRGGAVAVTLMCQGDPADPTMPAYPIPVPIMGFRGWRYRWWPREIEVSFPDWRDP